METLNKKLKKAILAIGILVAIVVGFSKPALAGYGEGEEHKATISQEDYDFLKSWVDRQEVPVVTLHTFIIYNGKSELVYETSKSEEEAKYDLTLQELLDHSDLVMNDDNTSYYVMDL